MVESGKKKIEKVIKVEKIIVNLLYYRYASLTKDAFL